MIPSSQSNSIKKSSLRDIKNFIASKLAPPFSNSHVIRLAIQERLDTEIFGDLVLISAPAGFGKTSLMAQYLSLLSSRQIPTAWLTLDQADNDMERFLAYLEEAFNRIELASAGSVNASTTQVAQDGEAGRSDLAYRIASQSQPFILFIDEFDIIKNAAVLEFCRMLISDLPANGRIVIGSRNQPNIGVAKLRARGRLIGISAQDLQFSLKETNELLRGKRDLPLSDAEVAILHERTEGWVSALQLASLSLALRKDSFSFISSFSGSNADVVEYLAEDVFACLPAELKQFLLCTCVLEELSAPLCNFITGRADSAKLLEQLERDGVFLTRTVDQARIYRYHSLFSGFLRDQLLANTQFDARTLQLAASDWFAREGRPVPAIEHAILARDYSLAMKLLGPNIEQLLMNGRLELLRRWFEFLPSEVLKQHPDIVMIFALALPGSPRYPKMMRILDEFANVDGTVPAWTVAPRAYLLTMEDQLSQCFQLCQNEIASRSLGLNAQDGCIALFYSNTLAAKNLLPEALRYLDLSKRAFSVINSVVGIALADQVQAMAEIGQGLLRNATVRLRSAYNSITGADQASIGATVGVALAVALYEGGDLVTSERLLNQCLALIEDSGYPDIQIRGTVTLARVVNWRGNHDRALELLTNLERLGHRAGLPRLVANAWLERSRMAVIAGDFSLAQDFFDYASNDVLWKSFEGFSPFANDVESVLIGRLRLMIHTNRLDVAISTLKGELKTAALSKRIFLEQKLKILLSYALYISGDNRSAMRHLKEVLQFSSAEGFVSLFLDEGPRISEMLKRYAAITSEESSAEGILPKFLDTLIHSHGYTDVQPFQTPKPARAHLIPESTETLTRREVEVLQMLASGISNQELADRLFVSESTIKTHLAKINAKLGTRNRAQAIISARQLGIIKNA